RRILFRKIAPFSCCYSTPKCKTAKGIFGANSGMYPVTQWLHGSAHPQTQHISCKPPSTALNCRKSGQNHSHLCASKSVRRTCHENTVCMLRVAVDNLDLHHCPISG